MSSAEDPYPFTAPDVADAGDAVSLARPTKKSKSKKWAAFVMPPESAFPNEDAGSRDIYPESTVMLAPGHVLTFFPQDMSRMYSAPSHLVAVTRGVVEYLVEYNQLGPNKTKMKLFCCTAFRKTSHCDNGYHCREVHPVMVAKTVDEPAPASSSGEGKVAFEFHPDITYNTVHSRSASAAAYPRLPPGITFRLSLPNTQSMLDDVASELVFVTKGSRDYYDQVMRNETPHVNMQHCAHFSKNGMCCFGLECQFVHVSNYAELHPVVRHQSSEDDSASNDASSKSSSRSSSSSGKKAAKGNKKSNKETPLSLEANADTSGAAALPSAASMLPAHHNQLTAQARGHGMHQTPAYPSGGVAQTYGAGHHFLPMPQQHVRYYQANYASMAPQQQPPPAQQQQFVANAPMPLFAQQRPAQQMWNSQVGLGQQQVMPQQVVSQQQQQQQQYYVVVPQQQPGVAQQMAVFGAPYSQQPQMVIMQSQQPQQQFMPSQNAVVAQPQQHSLTSHQISQSGAVGQVGASSSTASSSLHQLQNPFFQGLPT
jgi:hypothetical protein